MSDTQNIKQTLRERGICVVIPTYNNVGSIQDVMCRSKQWCADVVVVCDGCTDGTAELVAREVGIIPVIYEKNKGKGYALKKGFETAFALGFSYAITLDADGQHFPEDIPLMLAANQRNPGCIIVGERNLQGVDRSKGSSFANKFSNFWFCVQTGQFLRDTQTGFRLYPIKKLCGLRWLTARYEAELELLVFASWNGVKIVSEPISVYYPPRNERVSHFRPAKDFTRISILNTILCGLALVYGWPMKLLRGLLQVGRTIFSFLVFAIFSVFVITPVTWCVVHFGRMNEGKREILRKSMHFFAKCVVFRIGIPGIKISIESIDSEAFESPSIVICNHQSHLDLICQLALSHKLIFLTNDWVWRSKFFGYFVRNAEYLPVSDGIDGILPQLRSLVSRGYSIAIFPEGTRSYDCHIQRFHKGAFYIAEQLNLDITTLLLYGAGKVCPKGKYLLRKGVINLSKNKRFTQEELKNVGDVKQQTSFMQKYYTQIYADCCNKIEQDA